MKNLKTFRQVLENANYTDSPKKFSDLVSGDKIYVFSKAVPKRLLAPYELNELVLTKNPQMLSNSIQFTADKDYNYPATDADLNKTIIYDIENEWAVSASLTELTSILKDVFKISDIRIDFLIDKLKNPDKYEIYRSEFMNSRNIDKPKFMSIVDEVDEDEWFDDTDNFLDIFDDENDTITPEYYIDDSGSDRYWINPLYKGKSINKSNITCKTAESEERGRDIVITKLVNNNGDVILYNISED